VASHLAFGRDCFVASSIMHMALSYHKSDYRKLPDEDRVTDAVRSAGGTRGPAYFFPYFSFKEMKSPDVIEKLKRGPVGLLTVLPSGPPAMGKNLVPSGNKTPLSIDLLG
jgi:hypothetical protein